jgi:hypothetical protein
MSNKSAILKTFNTHFFEFIDDVIRIFPDNKDIKHARSSFEMIKTANPTAIAKAWYKFVYSPYVNVIEAGDVTFFFDKDYSGDINHLANSNEIMRVIDTIREPVRSMTDVEHGFTMKYIQNLSKLSSIYIEM